MNILCIGDIVGKRGCEFLSSHLRSIKRMKDISFVIANGENSADGNGITPVSAQLLLDSGVDVITSGNHVFRRKEVYGLLEENRFILRPANYPSGSTPGRGMGIYDMGKLSVAVINLLGTVFMEPLANPFETADRLVNEAKKETDIIILDVHAEATAEKKALAYFLDGRVSAVFGTHTHVQTADATVLPGGTGFITDVGMCGAVNSVLGIKPELAIEKMKNQLPVRFENADGDMMINAVIFDIDQSTGKCRTAQSLSIC